MTRTLIELAIGAAAGIAFVVVIRFLVAPLSHHYPISAASVYTAAFTFWTAWDSWHRQWGWLVFNTVLAGLCGWRLRRLLLARRQVKGRETT